MILLRFLKTCLTMLWWFITGVYRENGEPAYHSRIYGLVFTKEDLDRLERVARSQQCSKRDLILHCVDLQLRAYEGDGAERVVDSSPITRFVNSLLTIAYRENCDAMSVERDGTIRFWRGTESMQLSRDAMLPDLRHYLNSDPEENAFNLHAELRTRVLHRLQRMTTPDSGAIYTSSEFGRHELLLTFERNRASTESVRIAIHHEGGKVHTMPKPD